VRITFTQPGRSIQNDKVLILHLPLRLTGSAMTIAKLPPGGGTKPIPFALASAMSALTTEV